MEGFPLFFVLLIISKQVEIWLNISINRRVNDHYGYNIKISVTPRLDMKNWTERGRAGEVGWGSHWVRWSRLIFESTRRDGRWSTSDNTFWLKLLKGKLSKLWTKFCAAHHGSVVQMLCQSAKKRTRWTSENMRRRIVKIETSKRYICFSEERIGSCWDGLSGVLFSA